MILDIVWSQNVEGDKFLILIWVNARTVKHSSQLNCRLVDKQQNVLSQNVLQRKDLQQMQLVSTVILT